MGSRVALCFVRSVESHWRIRTLSLKIQDLIIPGTVLTRCQLRRQMIEGVGERRVLKRNQGRSHNRLLRPTQCGIVSYNLPRKYILQTFKDEVPGTKISRLHTVLCPSLDGMRTLSADLVTETREIDVSFFH